MRIYIKSLTEETNKKDVLENIRSGYRKGEIPAKEYFEAIYLQLFDENRDKLDNSVESITEVVEEEHFNEVRKFRNQNPVLRTVDCYDIGKIIEIFWCNCGKKH